MVLAEHKEFRLKLCKQ